MLFERSFARGARKAQQRHGELVGQEPYGGAECDAAAEQALPIVANAGPVQRPERRAEAVVNQRRCDREFVIRERTPRERRDAGILPGTQPYRCRSNAGQAFSRGRPLPRARRGDYLYLSTNDSVLRYRLEHGELGPTGSPETIVSCARSALEMPRLRSSSVATASCGSPSCSRTSIQSRSLPIVSVACRMAGPCSGYRPR